MRARHRKEWLRLALLAVACISLAGLAAVEFETGVARPEVEADRVPSPPAITTASPPTPLPLARFSAIAERPLFTQSRRPPEIASAAEDAPPPRQLDLVILGIISSHDGAVALIQPKSGGEVTPVRQGQKVSGWKVERIEPDRIFLQGERLEEVKLYEKSAAELQTVAKGSTPAASAASHATPAGSQRPQTLSEWRAAQQRSILPIPQVPPPKK